MSIFASAVIAVLSSDIVMAMIACAVPCWAVATLIQIFHKGADL